MIAKKMKGMRHCQFKTKGTINLCNQVTSSVPMQPITMQIVKYEIED